MLKLQTLVAASSITLLVTGGIARADPAAEIRYTVTGIPNVTVARLSDTALYQGDHLV